MLQKVFEVLLYLTCSYSQQSQFEKSGNQKQVSSFVKGYAIRQLLSHEKSQENVELVKMFTDMIRSDFSFSDYGLGGTFQSLSML